MIFQTTKIKCKTDCSLSSRCLYRLATQAITEIEEARAKGLGNQTTINAYFSTSQMSNGKFTLTIYPETNTLQKVEEITYSQFFEVLKLGQGFVYFFRNFWTKETGWQGLGNSGFLFDLSIVQKNAQYLQKHPEIDVVNYIKRLAGLSN